MTEPDRLLGTYLHLARASDQRRQPLVRDKLLVLAGVTAVEMGLEEISAQCRQRILNHNAWHLVRQWPTLAAALVDERFQTYLKQLRRRYSPEKAEHMLKSLDIEMGRERESYFTDHEYAAALLGTTPEPAAMSIAGASGPSSAMASAASAASSARGAPGEEVAQRPAMAAAPRATILAWLADWGPFAVGATVLAALAAVHALLGK